MEERGATIAVEQPEWSKRLGAVPAGAERRNEWNRLAAEVDAFRSRYAIEATSEVNPNQYQERAVGAELQQRVAAMQKSAALIKQPPADQVTRARVAEQTAAAAQRAQEAAQQHQQPLSWQLAARKPQTAVEASQAHRQAEADRAAAQLGRASRTPTTQDPNRTAAETRPRVGISGANGPAEMTPASGEGNSC